MTDSFSKISSMLESAKDFTIEAAVSASTRLVDTPSSARPKEIIKLLNSRSDRDILSGMKCVVSLVSRGEEGRQYFADVVKNVTTSNQKIKNLVLVYLIKYAEIEPDTALLSINSIQKSLNDKNPINRAKSIRSLASINIPSIVPILLLCIKRTITDPSPIVRASAAISIGKVYTMEDSNHNQLYEYLSQLLADSEPLVVSSAIKTYAKLHNQLPKSKKWTSIHGNFRRFCRIINDLDEWSQSFLIDILTQYCRLFLPKPKLYLKDIENQVIDLPESWNKITFPIYDVTFDKDLELFLDSLKLLVYSQSEIVILSVAKALFSLAPPLSFMALKVNVALVRIANSPDKQTAFFALQLIKNLSGQNPSVFQQFYKKFYVFPNDSATLATIKLEILSLLVTENNFKYVLEELKFYALNSNDVVVSKQAIKAIGRCSQTSSASQSAILAWCLRQIRAKNSSPILNELLTVIRYLMQQKSNTTLNVANEKLDIAQINYKLSSILLDKTIQLEGEAKASIIWLIGEFTEAASNQIGPDVLRGILKTFAHEPEPVRYQTLVLASKVFSYELNNSNDLDIVRKMFQHTLHLAKYDSSYDTRDRARMFNILLNSGSEQAQLASLFLQVPKPTPLVNNTTSDNSTLNKTLTYYLEVTDWSNEADLPSASVRKEAKVHVNKLGTSGVSSVSYASRSKLPTPVLEHAISSTSYTDKMPFQAKQAYQLQSLDEFFGSDDEEEEEEELELELELESELESELELELELEESEPEERGGSEGNPSDLSSDDQDSEADSHMEDPRQPFLTKWQ